MERAEAGEEGEQTKSKSNKRGGIGKEINVKRTEGQIDQEQRMNNRQRGPLKGNKSRGGQDQEERERVSQNKKNGYEKNRKRRLIVNC